MQFRVEEAGHYTNPGYVVFGSILVCIQQAQGLGRVSSLLALYDL